ncbi:hypothetical protein ACQUQU_04945 [Thalassolituus sp. LLYu03]|uniref:hypothetical protein n=1 Tax=Thalassolituus sp. LLYu03 TaxID=3421656 RepID=UPI003D268914
MTQPKYLKLVQLSAAYDLLVTSAFAIPGLAAFTLLQLQHMHQTLTLPGIFPAFLPVHLLFVQLMGSLVVVWSLLRLLRPEARLGLMDGVARLLFSLHMALTLFSHNGSALIGAFLLPEILWGLAQLEGYRRLRMAPDKTAGSLTAEAR